MKRDCTYVHGYMEEKKKGKNETVGSRDIEQEELGNENKRNKCRKNININEGSSWDAKQREL
jgi:hypothetical protein